MGCPSKGVEEGRSLACGGLLIPGIQLVSALREPPSDYLWSILSVELAFANVQTVAFALHLNKQALWRYRSKQTLHQFLRGPFRAESINVFLTLFDWPLQSLLCILLAAIFPYD